MDFRANAIGTNEIISLAAEAIKNSEHWIIGHHNLHSVYLWYREPRMRQFYERAEYVHIDGMFLVLLAKTLRVPLTRGSRATSLDFFPILASRAVKDDWRLFYLGSKPGVAAGAAAKLERKYPGLRIRTHHGYFNTNRSGEENQRVIAEINSYAPHVLLVGMGMPRQEIWILENRNDLSTNVIFPAGALMDYVAGEIPTPPRWLASVYLEWMFRLCSEPKRLWRRYLIEPWFVCAQIVKYLASGQSRVAQDGQHENSNP